MGRTQKPLKILVTSEELYHQPEIDLLREQGHSVSGPLWDGPSSDRYYDVIIGPKCWRIVPAMGKLSTYLTMMLAGVRAVKYPKKEVAS